MKRLTLPIMLGLMGMAVLILMLTSAGSPQLEVCFLPNAAYDHPINGRSFRFDLTNNSPGLVEVEVIRTETKTTNGWQVITNFLSPELHRFGPETAADVPLPVGPQTWRAVLRYRKMPTRIMGTGYLSGSRATNFSKEIIQ
jgi:hypothetical protein